jgi:23S rRNA (guanosine2251-2'-O)-methyltransferase
MKQDNSLIIGRKPLLESIEKGKPIDKILMQTDVKGEMIGDINRAAKEYNIPIQRVPTAKLHSLTRQQHQGVIGIGAIVNYYRLQDVIDNLFSIGESPRFIWCDGITDVRNIGAIARTAKCFNIHAVLLTEKGNAAINEDAVKASAGAILDITLVREKHTQAVLDICKDNGIAIYASSLQATKTLNEINFKEPFAMVLGSEEKGVTEQVYENCTATFLVPMHPGFDSLNVSVANGIICHHIFKQNN